MRTKIISILSILTFFLFGNAYSQNDHYFSKTIRSTRFTNGLSNQCVYLELPDVGIWGWLEITITDSYINKRTTGKLTKRFQIGKNPGVDGYFHQETEVPVAFGDVAELWSIGDIDNETVRIPIYSLTNNGNSITIRVEGMLTSTSAVQAIINDASLSQISSYTENVSRLYQTIKGSLSIGTTDPKGYKLAVNGSIRTKEVVVTADNWPDFVFQPEYTLRPLAEVEAHIQTHGYLPEVPSAQQVEESGIGLGQMNALLLKKVEELTLYSIEQERKLKRQNQRIEELERQNLRIEELESLIKGVLNR